MKGNPRSDLIRFRVPLLIGVILLAIYLGQNITISPFTTIGIIGFVLFISILLRRLEIAILLLLVIRPCLDIFSDVNIPLLGPSGRLNPAAILALTIITMGICHILVKRINILKIPMSRPYLLFLIITFSTISISPNKVLSVREWSRFLSIYVLYILITDMAKDEKDIRRIIQAIFISSVVPLVVGSYQIFKASERYGWMANVTQIKSIFVYPNGYAAYLALLLSILIVFTLYSRSKWRITWFLLGGGVMLINLLFTYIRAPIMGLVVAILIIGALKNKKVWILFPLLAILVYFYPPLLGRFNLLLNRSTYEVGSLAWRFRHWQRTIGLVISSPLVGLGPATFSLHALPLAGEALGAHNDCLRFLVEYGAFGLIAIIWMITILFKEGLEVFKKASSSFYQMIALSFIAMLTTHTVMSAGSNLSFRPGTSWYLFSLGAVVHRILSIERSKKDPYERNGKKFEN